MYSTLTWALAGVVAAISLYLALVLGLVLAGRRSDARAVVRLVPDCVVLLRLLLADPRVPRARKLVLAGLLGYLVLPLDLVPDFIPVAGHLDDAIVVALVLAWFLRRAGEPLVREHWPGPEASLNAVLRLASGRRDPGRVDRRDGDPRYDRADHDAPDGGVSDRGHGARVAQAGR